MPGETASASDSASASTNADQYFRRRRIRTIDTANKRHGVDPISLDTTTIGIADTLPEYHAVDNGLRGRNLYSSDTKNERISSHPPLPYRGILQATLTFLEQSPLYQLRSCYRICGKTPLSQILLNVVYRILFRWTRQSLSIGCLVVQLKLDQLVIDVVDHPAQPVSTHGKKFCCPFTMDVAVAVHHAKFYHGRFDRRDIGVAVLRTIIPALRQTQSPQFSLSDFLILHACCTSCCYWMVMSIQSKQHSTSFQRGRRCRQRLICPAAFFCQAFNFVHSSLSSCERGCSTSKDRGVN